MSDLVSVIVLNYNGADLLRECLPTLEDQSYTPIEILVADNGSIDESRRIVEESGAEFLNFGENLGFGKANNLAAERADGEYLFFVNNDMRFRPDCISHQVSYLQDNPEYFSVSCTQFSWDGQEIVHAGNMIRQGGLSKTTFPFLTQFGKDVDEPSAVPWACAGNLFVDSEKFDELGGFDNTFFLNVEDVDLCLRAWMRGWPSLYLPAKDNNFIYHKVSETGLSWRGYSIHRNMIRFMIKTMPTPMLIKYLGGKAVQGIGALAIGDFPTSRDIFRSIIYNAHNIRSTYNARKEVLSNSTYSLETIIGQFIDADYPVSPDTILDTQ